MSRVYPSALVGLIVFLCYPLNATETDQLGASAEAVRNALDEQNAWLDTSPNGAAWQAYLLTEQLQTEITRGESADRRLVARVLGRYDSGVQGLGRTKFQRTAAAIRRWANQLHVPMAWLWSERLRAIAARPRAISSDQRQSAKRDLAEAAERLNAFLSQADESKQRGWRQFLRWDVLQTQLSAEDPDWAKLNAVAERYYDGHPGLELPPFVDVRDALRKYLVLGTLSGQSAEAVDSALSGQILSLAEALEAYHEQPSAKTAGKAATLLDWLDQLRLVPGLAAEIRPHFSQPNLLMQVSEEVIARRFTDTVDETRPVSEMILGTYVRGTARTIGTVSADVVAHPSAARIDIVLTGQTHTNSLGRQKPVTIRSRSRTDVSARKPLYVEPSRITASPAAAYCDTHTTICNITPDGRIARRLVERVAWKRAATQTPRAERIASARAERRVARQMDARTEELLVRAKADLRNEFNQPLRQRGLIPAEMRTHSSDTHVHFAALQASKAQFAATEPHQPPTDGFAVVALVHESFLNNTAEQALAGMRLTDERIAALMEELTGSVPEELRIGEDKTPWSISFDWEQPVSVQFDNQTLTLAVRGRQFTSGDRTLDKAMEISATYQMEVTPAGVHLTRQGDIAVDFPSQREGQRPSNQEIFFRTLMRTKFAELFKPELQGEGVALPGRWESVGRIRTNHLTTDGGWLSLGWK